MQYILNIISLYPPQQNIMKSFEFDYIIVGAGTHGLSSALHLSLAKSSNGQPLKVGVIEQFKVCNEEGSSHGPTRINRSAYWDGFYTKLNKLCLKEYWPKAQEILQKKIIHQNPYLLFNEVEEVYKEYLNNSKEQDGFNLLSPQQVCNKYPEFPLISTSFKAIQDPSAAIIAAGDYLRGLYKYLKKQPNVTIIEDTKIISIQNGKQRVCLKSKQSEFFCKKTLLSCGHWISELVPQMKKVTIGIKQAVIYLDLKNVEKYKKGKFPTFTHRRQKIRFYCLPDWDGSGVKLARHISTVEEVPNSKQQRVEQILKQAKEYFGDNLKGVKKYEECWYTTTKKEDFIIDWVDPGTDKILVCSCCSGHSFKFSPLIGKITKDLLVEGKTLDIVQEGNYRWKIPYHEGINLK